MKFGDGVGATDGGQFTEQLFFQVRVGPAVVVTVFICFAFSLLRNAFHDFVDGFRREVKLAEREGEMRRGTFDLTRLCQQMRVGLRGFAVAAIGWAAQRLSQESRLSLLQRADIGLGKQRAQIGVAEQLVVEAVDDGGDVCFASDLREQ